MAQTQFSLAWDSHKSNICNGFSALQQNGEFVDMTLAADGHLVKVHQVLIALASPYLKDMITTAPCPHPVIYLNNISHKLLCYLLEYIYTGEVVVPCDCLASFGEAARSLHIKGLENINSPADYTETTTRQSTTPVTRSMQTADSSSYTHSLKRKTPDIFQEQQVTLPSTARKIFIKAEGPLAVKQIDNTHDYTGLIDESTNDSDEEFKIEQSNADGESDKVKEMASNLLFTVSIRGSLQVILNRYIYNLNSTTSKAGLRRWRCVDYRNNKCSAFIVTKGNVVVNRANVHSHPFHDKKILAKLEKKSVFSALDEVEAYKEKEKEMDKSDQITVDEDILDSYTADKNDC